MLLDGATGAFGYRRRHGSAFLPFPFLPVQWYIAESASSQMLSSRRQYRPTVYACRVSFSGKELPVSSNQSVDGQIRNKGSTGFRLQDYVPSLSQRG